jgi:hypothetical protein
LPDLQHEPLLPLGHGGASNLEDSLGKLVKFDQRPKADKDGTKMSGDAQILMFTGVRYERGTPPARLDPTRPQHGRG